MTRFFSLLSLCLVATLLVPAPMLAANADSDRVQIGRDIRIQTDDKVADVVCIFCSIYVRGQVSGDVTAVAGSIFVEPGASIAGDVTSVGGSTRLDSGTQVAGDLTAVGGVLRRDPQASVAGDVTAVGGRGWVFLIFLLPFLFLGGIIALIIWLVQRARRPAPVPAYTMHRN